MAQADITMYGADWCGDCRRSKRVFEELDIQVNHIDVDADLSAAEKVIEINGGAKSIPVIVFSDGTHLTEPSDNDLKAKLSALGIALLLLLAKVIDCSRGQRGRDNNDKVRRLKSKCNTGNNYTCQPLVNN